MILVSKKISRVEPEALLLITYVQIFTECLDHHTTAMLLSDGSEDEWLLQRCELCDWCWRSFVDPSVQRGRQRTHPESCCVQETTKTQVGAEVHISLQHCGTSCEDVHFISFRTFEKVLLKKSCRSTNVFLFLFHWTDETRCFHAFCPVNVKYVNIHFNTSNI